MNSLKAVESGYISLGYSGTNIVFCLKGKAQ
jgi:hypothetical protein